MHMYKAPTLEDLFKEEIDFQCSEVELGVVFRHTIIPTPDHTKLIIEKRINDNDPVVISELIDKGNGMVEQTFTNGLPTIERSMNQVVEDFTDLGI